MCLVELFVLHIGHKCGSIFSIKVRYLLIFSRLRTISYFLFKFMLLGWVKVQRSVLFFLFFVHGLTLSVSYLPIHYNIYIMSKSDENENISLLGLFIEFLAIITVFSFTFILQRPRVHINHK